MKLNVIGSSSKGNCYLLETPTGSILLDCGVPFQEIQKVAEFDLGKVKACLITHEHQDHTKSIEKLTKAGIDCYLGVDTFNGAPALFKKCPQYRLNRIFPKQYFNLGDFDIMPLEAEHDVPCLAYLILYRPTGERLLYATDTYYLRYRFNKLNYILVECNYCPDILERNIQAGLIAEPLKKRLLESHFSLDNVKDFLQANDLTELRKVVLIHLSDGNSDAQRMQREIQDLILKEVEVADSGQVIELNLFQF